MKSKKGFRKSIAVMVTTLLVLGSSLQIATAAKDAPVRMIPRNFSALAKDVSPAVVHIRVEKTLGDGEAQWRQFENHPFRGDDRFKDFFDDFFGGKTSA